MGVFLWKNFHFLWIVALFFKIVLIFLSLLILCHEQGKSLLFALFILFSNGFLPLSLSWHKKNDMGACLFMFFFLQKSSPALYLCRHTTSKIVIFVFLFFFKIVFSFLSFSRHVTNLCGDLPRSAICKLEHSSYEKLFLRKFCNQKKTSKIPLRLEDKACCLTLACLHLDVFQCLAFPSES